MKKIGIRDRHPGSATLVYLYLFAKHPTLYDDFTIEVSSTRFKNNYNQVSNCPVKTTDYGKMRNSSHNCKKSARIFHFVTFAGCVQDQLRLRLESRRRTLEAAEAEQAPQGE